MADQLGHKVTGTFIGLKGDCGHGHKAGDTIELSVHNTSGLCGMFYHAIFPYVNMLQFGGKWPDSWGGSTVELDCPDKWNCLSLRLQPE